MMMPGSPSIVGRAAITSTVAVFMKMNIVRKAKTTDVWGDGDLLAEEGTASLFDQKGVELDHAKYLVVWKKEDGKWKLFRDMWNKDLAPQPSK
jgi:ketosteroid isomerase-like protein